MKKLLCWIGIHDYEQKFVAEIPGSVYESHGYVFQMAGRRFYDETCRRCGHTIKAL